MILFCFSDSKINDNSAMMLDLKEMLQLGKGQLTDRMNPNSPLIFILIHIFRPLQNINDDLFILIL